MRFKLPVQSSKLKARSSWLLFFHHHRPQHPIHFALVPRPLFPAPRQHIGVQIQCHPLLRGLAPSAKLRPPVTPAFRCLRAVGGGFSAPRGLQLGNLPISTNSLPSFHLETNVPNIMYVHNDLHKCSTRNTMCRQKLATESLRSS